VEPELGLELVEAVGCLGLDLGCSPELVEAVGCLGLVLDWAVGCPLGLVEPVGLLLLLLLESSLLSKRFHVECLVWKAFTFKLPKLHRNYPISVVGKITQSPW